MPPPTWQQHHHLERITIDPHRELRESLTIEGMSWVSDRDLTTHSVSQWGFLLGVIRPTSTALKEQTGKRFGWKPPNLCYVPRAFPVQKQVLSSDVEKVYDVTFAMMLGVSYSSVS